LPQRQPVALNPRKLPVQARSAVTVDAVLDATIQVLLRHGKERLTTTLLKQFSVFRPALGLRAAPARASAGHILRPLATGFVFAGMQPRQLD
jgi:hypothetical protein